MLSSVRTLNPFNKLITPPEGSLMLQFPTMGIFWKNTKESTKTTFRQPTSYAMLRSTPRTNGPLRPAKLGATMLLSSLVCYTNCSIGEHPFQYKSVSYSNLGLVKLAV